MDIRDKIELLATNCKKNKTPFPHTLVITTQPILADYLSSLVERYLGGQTHRIPAIESILMGDLCGYVTNLNDFDLLRVNNVEYIKKSIIENFASSLNEFSLNLIIDSGLSAREVGVRLNRFTLIATATDFSKIAYQIKGAFFLIIDELEAKKLAHYYITELLDNQKFDIDEKAWEEIFTSAQIHNLGIPALVQNLLKYLQMTNSVAKTICSEDVVDYLRFSGLPQVAQNLEAKQSRQITKEVRREVWRRDGGQCVLCSSQQKLEFDHIIPFSKGGSNTLRNIQLLCEMCNRSKSAIVG